MFKQLLAGTMLLSAANLTFADDVKFLNAGGVLAQDLPFSEAVQVDDMIYLSGQVGVKPGSMTLVEGGIRAETKQVMENIQAVLVKNGLSLNNVVKCTVMLADIGEWATFNEVYREYFSAPYPTRSAFGTSGLGLGARVEVECWAAQN